MRHGSLRNGAALAAVIAMTLFIGRPLYSAPPLQRAEMKRLLEAQKQAKPHLPMPPADAIEGGNNNSRFRDYYLPQGWYYYAMGSDPFGEVDKINSARMFWIVSRSNDCRYCMGHQEGKMARLESSDSAIGAMDGDWRQFDPKSRAFMELARTMTLRPHEMGDTKVSSLLSFLDPKSTVAAVYMTARFNATNRWTGSLNIPQDSRSGRSYLTPTDPSFHIERPWIAEQISPKRPPLKSFEQAMKMVENARQRQSAVPVPESTTTDRNWLRVLSYLGDDVPANHLGAYQAIQTTGKLPALLKAKLAWTIARQNRAWYSLAEAERRLLALGMTREAIAEWEKSDKQPAEQAAIDLVTKVTSFPAEITDNDFNAVRKDYTDHEIGEVVYIGCFGNFFDRFTEALLLPVE